MAKNEAFGGWLSPVVSIVFAIIFLSILVGVGFIVLIDTQSAISSSSSAFNSWNTISTNSVQAANFNSFSTGNFYISWSGVLNVSATHPATVVIVTNTVTTGAVNTPEAGAISASAETFTVIATQSAGNQIISGTANVYQIKSITVTGLTPGDTGGIVTATETYYPFATNVLITNYPASGNVISATGTVTAMQPSIGGGTAIGEYTTVAANLVTLVNFITIIILLAIVSVLFLVLALALGGVVGGNIGEKA